MQSQNITKEDYTWTEEEIFKEKKYLSDKNKYFFNTYRLKSPLLYKLEQPSSTDDSMFVVLAYNNNVILFDDIEELFALGKLNDNKLFFAGNFTSLEDSIQFLKNSIDYKEKEIIKNDTFTSPGKGDNSIPNDFFKKE